MRCLENLSNVRLIHLLYKSIFCHLSGKDIEIALTEIRELQNSIENLVQEEKVKDEKLSELKRIKYELER